MTLTSRGFPVFVGPVRCVKVTATRVRCCTVVQVVTRTATGVCVRTADVPVGRGFTRFHWFAQAVRTRLLASLDPVDRHVWRRYAELLLAHSVNDEIRTDLSTTSGVRITINSSTFKGSRLHLKLTRHVGEPDRQREFSIALPPSARWSFKRARRAIVRQTDRLIVLAERSDYEWQRILAVAEEKP